MLPFRPRMLIPANVQREPAYEGPSPVEGGLTGSLTMVVGFLAVNLLSLVCLSRRRQTLSQLALNDNYQC